MNQFLYGAIAMGYAVAAVFFLRFWRTTHDRLFGMFAGAFALLAIHRVALLVHADVTEHRPVLYAGRLAAYLLILYAVLDKNRDRTG